MFHGEKSLLQSVSLDLNNEQSRSQRNGLQKNFPELEETFARHLLESKDSGTTQLELAQHYFERKGDLKAVHQVLLKIHQEWSFSDHSLSNCIASFLRLGQKAEAEAYLDPILREYQQDRTFTSDGIEIARSLRLLGQNHMARGILIEIRQETQARLDEYEDMEIPGNQLHYMEMEESMNYLRDELRDIDAELSLIP